MDQVFMVREFVDVFPEDLPRLPLKREIKFNIELVPSTKPILIEPFTLAPTKLKKLK
jgi:hypothetical protein